MDFADIVRALYRRWWVMVPVVVLTAIGVVNAEPNFEADAALLLAGPDLMGEPPDQSESGDSSPEVVFTPAVLAEIVGSDSARARLEQGSSQYELETGPDGIIRISAGGPSPVDVLATAAAVISELQTMVVQFEERSDRNVVFEVLSSPTTARPSMAATGDGDSELEYTATGAVFYEVETSAVSEPDENPYSTSGETLRILQEVASTPAVKALVVSGIPGADYEVTFQERDIAPIMYVNVTADTKADTFESLTATLSFLDGELRDRQALAGAPESTWIELQRLAAPDGPADVFGSRRTPMMIITFLGVVAAVSLAVLVDGALSYRSARLQQGAVVAEGLESRPVHNDRDLERQADPDRERQAI